MIRRLSQQYVHEGIIRLRLDTVEFPNGHRDQYTVIEYPRSVAVLPIRRDGRVTLVRQYRYALNKYSLEIPGRVVDPWEDVQTAARRELEEETGVTVADLLPLLTVCPDTCLSTQQVTIFLGSGARRTARPRPDRHEMVETHALTLAQALAAIRSGAIRRVRGRHPGVGDPTPPRVERLAARDARSLSGGARLPRPRTRGRRRAVAATVRDDAGRGR